MITAARKTPVVRGRLLRRSGRPSRSAGRAGVTLVEVLVSTLLGLALLAATARMVTSHRKLLLELAWRSEAVSAARTVRELLDAEAADAPSSARAWEVARDTLALRAFRGVGLVCSTPTDPTDPSSGAVVVMDRGGVRAPDPAKDSVLVVGSDGRVRVVAALAAVGPEVACPVAGSSAELWTLSAPVPPDAVLLRYFERGSYHASGDAFRYRRGRSGRQPLTSEVVDVRASSFVEDATGLHFSLAVPATGPTPWRVWLAPPGPG